MGRFLRNNGLSVALFTLFIGCQIGLSFVGLRHENSELADHGQPPVTYREYVTSGEFLEATMENWESEFLQMFAFVILTAVLFQKGSAESKSLDEPEEVDKDPRLARNPDRPWPVRKGGLVLRLYEHSLSGVLFLLFVVSFYLHARGGAQAYSAEQLLHGGSPVSTLEYAGTSRFWFESLQNWQSEFFSVGAIIVLAIFLRERGSPESKPVAAPHSETGHG
ncbi:MAG TPA: DUF6766 family protein [Rubrobacteraceae bacterium]|nr:DUF6766 family protein [Rubrobacteraceae bacterium]